MEKFSRWEYDTAANGLGKLQRVYDSTAINGSAQYQQSYSYDALGRLSITTTRMPGHLNQMGEHYEKQPMISTAVYSSNLMRPAVVVILTLMVWNIATAKLAIYNN